MRKQGTKLKLSKSRKSSDSLSGHSLFSAAGINEAFHIGDMLLGALNRKKSAFLTLSWSFDKHGCISIIIEVIED